MHQLDLTGLLDVPTKILQFMVYVATLYMLIKKDHSEPLTVSVTSRTSAEKKKTLKYDFWKLIFLFSRLATCGASCNSHKAKG
jgi:hypothetical protein